MSPLAAQLANESGYASAYGPFLPRPTRTFTEGAFGPFSPILPVPVDAPQEGLERPEARRFQYPVGWNLPTGQPGMEGLKLASFSTLQRLADSYSICRAAIEYRKNQIRGIEWDIIPTPDAQKAYQSQPAKLANFGKRRAKAVKFFSRPDPNFTSYATWISALMEEVLVFDAMSLLIRPVRGRGMGKGVLGSDLDSLVLVNGPTIRPLLNLHGGTPRPPAPAYQQFLYGVPRSDIMTMITQADLDEAGLTGAQEREFRGDQMLYIPMVPRTWTPYGFPPVERALIPIYTGLQKQSFQYDWFSESTVPAAYVIPGDTAMTPNQLRELQDALNAIAGDPAWKQKIIVLPPNSKIEPQKLASAADELDQWLATELTMAFGLTPLELGISPGRSHSSSSGAQNQMAKMTQDRSEDTGVTPLLKYLADIFNLILVEVCGQTDMQFTFEGLQQEEDQDALTGILVQQFQNGFRTLDECRQELNLQPFGTPETSEPLIVSPTGVMPITVAVQNAVNAAEQQQAATAQTKTQTQIAQEAHDVNMSTSQPSAAVQDAQAQARTAQTRAQTESTRARTQMSQESHNVAMNTPPPPTAAEVARESAAISAQTKANPGQAAAATANAEMASSKKSAPDPVILKRAEAEFSALARHLAKGRPVSTWDARFIPQSALADVAKGMAQGLASSDAVSAAKARVVLLAPSEYAWAAKAGGSSQQQQQPGATPVTEAVSLASGAVVTAEASAAIAAGVIRGVDALDELSRWPGWQHDRKIAAAYVSRLEAAFRDAVASVRAFLARLLNGAIRVTPTQAAQDVRKLITGSVAPVLESLWAEGYETGAQAAAALTAGDGVPAAGANSSGLRTLVEQSGKSIIEHICETRLDDLPAMIATALADGTDAGTLADDIEEALNAASRCGMIASTELARAIGAGAMDRYRDDGVDLKQWLVAPDESVCKICRGNEADGPIPLSQAFSGGSLSGPAHPNCRCTVIPARVRGFDLTGMQAEPLPGFNTVPLRQPAMAKSHAGESSITCGQGHRHWGALGAAGLLIKAPRPSGEMAYLLQQRAHDAADNAGKWSVFGGALLSGESPLNGAKRETREELGTLPSSVAVGQPVADDHGGWAYTTFLADAAEPFWPPFDGETPEESANWGWFTAAELRDLDLHPGFRKMLPKLLASEKSLHRTVGLTGQETWEDAEPASPPAAGGGSMTMPPVPGGVPGYTAGAEPPRWDGSSPQLRVLVAPADGDDAAWPQGRARSERPHAAWPQGPQGMDGYWPSGMIGTMQAGESSPGGARGVPPSTVGSKGSQALENGSQAEPDLEPGTAAGSDTGSGERGDWLSKVGKEGYVHGWKFVGIPSTSVATTSTWETHVSDDRKMEGHTTTDYKRNNRWLRAGNSPVPHTVDRERGPIYFHGSEAHGVAHVDDVMRRSSLNHDAVVYRSLGTKAPVRGGWGKLKPGDSFTDLGFVSTASDPDDVAKITAHEESRGRAPWTARLIVPAGTHAYYSPKSPSADFDELTLDRGLTYTVTGRDEASRRLELTVSGNSTPLAKKRIALADLVKVGPEGYIHGYICVRPPCGPKYAEAEVNKKKWTVHHGGEKIGVVSAKDKNGQYSATHFKTDDAGVQVREKLPRKFDDHHDAFKAIPLYHNIAKLGEQPASAGVKDSLEAARQAYASGDDAKAAEHLGRAAELARSSGDESLAKHIEHTRSALPGEEAKPAEPVARSTPEAAPAPAQGKGRTYEEQWADVRRRVLGGDENPAVQSAENNASETMHEKYGKDGGDPAKRDWEEWSKIAVGSYEDAAMAHGLDPETGSIPVGEENEDGWVNGERVEVQTHPQLPVRPGRITGLAGPRLAQVEYDDQPGVQHVISAYQLQKPSADTVQPSAASAQEPANSETSGAMSGGAQSLRRARNSVSMENVTPDEHELVSRELAKHIDLLPADAKIDVRVVSQPEGGDDAGFARSYFKTDADGKPAYEIQVKKDVITGASDDAFNGLVKSGFLAGGATGDHAVLQNVMAHEFGHVLAESTGEHDRLALRHGLDHVSKYGRTHPTENLAEGYAKHFFGSSNPVGADIVAAAHGDEAALHGHDAGIAGGAAATAAISQLNGISYPPKSVKNAIAALQYGELTTAARYLDHALDDDDVTGADAGIARAVRDGIVQHLAGPETDPVLRAGIQQFTGYVEHGANANPDDAKKAFEKWVAAAPAGAPELHRGLTGPKAGEDARFDAMHGLQPGDTFSHSGITSWTSSAETGENYASGGRESRGIILHLKPGANARDIHEHSQIPAEREWAVPAGSYRVTGRREENGITHLDVEQAGLGSKPVESAPAEEKPSTPSTPSIPASAPAPASPPTPASPSVSSSGGRATSSSPAPRESLKVFRTIPDVKKAGLSSYETDAVKNYANNGFRSVNTYLRVGGVDPAIEAFPALAERARQDSELTVQQLDSAFNRGPALEEPITVYRGIIEGADKPELFGAPGSRLGSVFTDKAYVSTSADKQIADSSFSAAGTGNALLHITVPAGTKVVKPGSVALRKEEKELILPRDSSFRIDRDEVDASGQRHVHLTLQPAGTAVAEPEKTPIPAAASQSRLTEVEPSAPSLPEQSPTVKAPLRADQVEAFHQYTFGGSLNHDLRSGKPLSTADQKTVSTLDTMAKPLDKKLKLYRGIANASQVFGAPGTAKDSTITDSAFNSATTDVAAAREYAEHGWLVAPGQRAKHGDHAIVIILAKPGDKVIRGRDYLKPSDDHYTEDVIPRGTSYRVVNDFQFPLGGGKHERRIVVELNQSGGKPAEEKPSTPSIPAPKTPPGSPGSQATSSSSPATPVKTPAAPAAESSQEHLPVVYSHKNGKITRSAEVPQAWSDLTPREKNLLRNHEIHIVEGRSIHPAINALGINVAHEHEAYGVATGLSHENKLLVTRKGVTNGDLQHEMGHSLDRALGNLSTRSAGPKARFALGLNAAIGKEIEKDPKTSPHFTRAANGKNAAYVKERWAELYSQWKRGVRRYDLGAKLSPELSQRLTSYFDEELAEHVHLTLQPAGTAVAEPEKPPVPAAGLPRTSDEPVSSDIGSIVDRSRAEAAKSTAPLSPDVPDELLDMHDELQRLDREARAAREAGDQERAFELETRAGNIRYGRGLGRKDARGIPEVAAEHGLGKPGQYKAHLLHTNREYRRDLAAENGLTPEEGDRRMEAELREIAKNRVATRVTNSGLDKILDDGAFKTQFETNRSKALKANDTRAAHEETWFGYPQDLKPELRPVYGYVMDGVDRPVGIGSKDILADTTDQLSSFGTTQVVLKDSVKQRATFNVGDSLTNAEASMPSRMLDPKAQSFAAYDRGIPSATAPGRFEVKHGALNAAGLRGLGRDYTSSEFRQNAYNEVQVHSPDGKQRPLTTADIDHVLFDKMPPKALRDKLDGKGIPWKVWNAETIAKDPAATPEEKARALEVTRQDLEAVNGHLAYIRKRIAEYEAKGDKMTAAEFSKEMVFQQKLKDRLVKGEAALMKAGVEKLLASRPPVVPGSAIGGST